jgi:hypothetical protein
MRESRFTQIAKLAYHIAQQTLPTYAHAKSRHDYTFPQRVACIILKIYLNYTYREMEEWLLATDQVRQALQLTRVPDHTTLYRTFAKLSQAQWQQLNDALLQHLQVNEMTVAVNTTGFRNDTARAYYQSRRGSTRRSWGRVCGGYREPVDCGDAGGARYRFGREVVSPVAGAGASVCGTQRAFGAVLAVGRCRV